MIEQINKLIQERENYFLIKKDIEEKQKETYDIQERISDILAKEVFTKGRISFEQYISQNLS